MLSLFGKEREENKKYADYSNPTMLDHGEGFIQQNLHELIHQADRARNLYGKDSIEYESLISRVANQLAKYSKGGNFTMGEISHYDREHTESMKDAWNKVQDMTGIPMVNYVQGHNWTNVVANLGNSEGDGLSDSSVENKQYPAGLLRPRVKRVGTPSTYDDSTGERKLSTTSPYIGGMEIYTRHMSSTAVSKKK